MFKKILLSGLTIGSLVLGTATSTRAEFVVEVNPQFLQDVDQQRTKGNNDYEQAPGNDAQSMRYVTIAMRAHENGNYDRAMYYYGEALKIDSQNAYAFMGAGILFDQLNQKENGITSMKAAAVLFYKQNNQKFYHLAIEWLEDRGVDVTG